ncbi:multidrug efflux pump subunit AcrA (membrane-fusion protein) [Leucobacter luti]|uniref:Multidrug efflux pump subunit AcrA (Membrane-fusion protein) n=1 Tax=Leucobacter luti TaxID=340320 RepID=A0A4R6S8Y0_9MICO|nr:peptidoglycan-binding protein [Leucobacter luti]TDP95346.1 multidrug efflux pump subunit AcrA (membrane-fusion protein) [Leucobacter luti]
MFRRTSEVSRAPDPHELSAATPAEEDGAGQRRRTRLLWIAGIALLVGLGGGGSYLAYASASEPTQEPTKPKLDTAKIEEGTLTGSRTIPGVLDFAQTRDQASEIAGTLTGTPAAGSTVDHGGVLFSVDNQGVYLFNGALPAWRAFETGMSDGPDVKQLEENLSAAGHFGYTPDEEFDWNTKNAIALWQESTGQAETGRIDLGRVVFSASSVRIADVLASVGDRVGPGIPVVKLSALQQAVTADLKLGDQKLAVLDTPVEIQLPGGTTTTGKITGIGQPTERESNGSKSVVIPITVTLDTPEDAQGIQKANVTVDVPSETREGVLSVPLEALIALPDGGFGVETAHADGTTSKVPVTTGLFAGGRVEVSGEKIKAGMEVVVPGS